MMLEFWRELQSARVQYSSNLIISGRDYSELKLSCIRMSARRGALP